MRERFSKKKKKAYQNSNVYVGISSFGLMRFGLVAIIKREKKLIKVPNLNKQKMYIGVYALTRTQRIMLKMKCKFDEMITQANN